MNGLKPGNICLLPIGCDTKVFIVYKPEAPKILAIIQSFGVYEDQLLILTTGEELAS